MSSRNIIWCFLFLTLVGCRQTKDKRPYNESRELVPNPEGYKKDSSYPVKPGIASLEYIIFGVYCGECGSHCATMYQYNTGGNSHTFLVDSSDSYFHNKGNIRFEKSAMGEKRFYLAQSIFGQIPNKLLTTTKFEERFGCPDYTDGCGIYFEFKQGSKVKKFYIDYDTSQLTGEIKQFAEYLKTTIGQLNGKT